MKKVLVTGASGFIGRNTLKTLVKKGYEVHAVSSRIINKNSRNINWHCVNLLDKFQIEKLFKLYRPNHLIHFAWSVEPSKYLNADENLIWLQSSIDILKSFTRYGGNRVVIAGTCFEYDLRYGYLNEKLTNEKPNSLYGECKLSLNNISRIYAIRNGLSLAWGRIFYVYGPYESPKRVIPYVINSLLNREVAYCSHGEQIRDYLNVYDVASAFVDLLESNVEGNVNIASGNPIKLKEIFLKIGRMIDREDLISLGAIKTSHDEQSLIVADIKRLRDEIGWTPCYSLDKGLNETIEWWKKQRG